MLYKAALILNYNPQICIVLNHLHFEFYICVVCVKFLIWAHLFH